MWAISWAPMWANVIGSNLGQFPELRCGQFRGLLFVWANVVESNLDDFVGSQCGKFA